MVSNFKNSTVYISLVILTGIWIFLNQSNILFWDTIQFAGKHASFYFENGFSKGFLLPDNIDSGHPPFFGIALAAAWKLFGKSLVVSHWFMFPFLIGILNEAFRLAEYLLPRRHWLFPVLLLVCPFFLGHSILVSPDLILVFGFLLCLRGVCTNNSKLVFVGSIILVLISLRGIALLLPIAIFSLYNNYGLQIRLWWKNRKKYLLEFLPAVLIALGYLMVHYMQKGWIAGHENSPWSGSFEKVEFSIMLKNVLFFGHHLLDFGMLFIYGLIIYKWKYLALLKGRLIWLWFFMLVVLLCLVVPYSGLLNHRYFLPMQVVALIIAAQLLNAISKQWLIVSIVALLFLGNFWIYPDRISQGWDSTLGHYGFYQEIEKFNHYLDENNIRTNQIGTTFPLKGENKYRCLNNDNSVFLDYHQDSSGYVLYSNIMNDYTDEDLESFKYLEKVYESSTLRIKFILYKK